MLCPCCRSLERAERAAIESPDGEVLEVEGQCTCDLPPLDILYVKPEWLRNTAQVGTPCTMTWPELITWLSRPSFGDSKEAAGSWSPALYRDNVRRKAHLVSVGALVVDIDTSGDVDAVADAFGKYAAIVHETFNSTSDAPRCRAVLRLAQAVDSTTYESVHDVIRAKVNAGGFVADNGAKDSSRLSFLPVRRLGSGYRFRVTQGRPLDALAILAAHPPPPPPERRPMPILSGHAGDLLKRASRYLDRCAPAVSGSGGHTITFAVVRAVWAWTLKGLPESTAWALLVDYNARCEPPWSDRELAHKWAEAQTKAKLYPELQDRRRGSR